MDNHELLREYVERQSEAAFAELVSRHVNLVYSTALRIVRNHTVAEDVAQMVFIKLARKAGSIQPETLPGWLYRVTHDHAANVLRGEDARRNREVEAMNLAEANTESAPVWNEIAPGLDAAMQTLNETEQNAVVLHFFQGQSWREVGKALAASEDTAQRRVGSALEKMRSHFLRRGITVSAAVLGMAIGANAVQAAPATLGTHLATGALAAAGAKGTGVISTILKALLTKWQIAATVVTGVAVVGVATMAVVRHRAETVTAETVREGLVLHLGFDQEAPDGRVSDDSSQGNHGVVTGAKWNPSGRRGGAYEFRADGDQIEVPDHPSLNPNQITVSVWVKSPTPDANWRYIVDKGFNPGYNLSIAGSAGTEEHTAVVSGSPHWGFTGRRCVWCESSVADGQWHQITTTYDGRQHCMYVDGRLAGNAHPSRKNLVNRLNLVIGRNLNGTPEQQIGRSFRGLIDELQIFDRALSPAEVSLLFASADR